MVFEYSFQLVTGFLTILKRKRCTIGSPKPAFPPSTLPSPDQIWLTESDYLALPGEVQAGEDDYGEVPVRLLHNFSIYWRDTDELVTMPELFEVDKLSGVVAKGEVQIWQEDGPHDEDLLLEEEDDTMQYLQLSDIVEFNIHHIILSSYHYVELNP